LSVSGEVQVSQRGLDNCTIQVVDGLIAADIVRVLYEFLRALPFSLSDYDTKATQDVLHWKYEFDLKLLPAHPLLRVWHDRIVAMTHELFPGRSVRLARVHCNCHPYGDLQHAHHDISPGVTALYFANVAWQDDWQGETIFYDGTGEPFHAVAPRPGRVLFFSGEIIHRGGVPSRACPEPRFSVAFKFAEDG